MSGAKKSAARMLPVVGRQFQFRDDPKLGDYSNTLVDVEKGPRFENTPGEQYRVSWGTGSHDVDWVDTIMFEGGKVV